jgi:hypothetical protein
VPCHHSSSLFGIIHEKDRVIQRQQMHQFCLISKIGLFYAFVIAGETPALLDENAPKIVLHIVPFGAFEPGARFNIDPLMNADKRGLMKPLRLASGGGSVTGLWSARLAAFDLAKILQRL